MVYLDLFLSFFKIGCVSFGGGYSILPFLNKHIVTTKKWCTEEELLNYYTIGQLTPGVISVNVAGFIGYKMAGVFGSVFATLGIITPSIIIISILASYLHNLNQSYLIYLLNGIKLAICILMIDNLYQLMKKNIKNYHHLLIYLGVLALTFLNISNVIIILGLLILIIGVKFNA